MKINLEPQDTVNLLPGKYYYSIKVKTTDETDATKYSVETVVDKTLFYILE